MKRAASQEPETHTHEKKARPSLDWTLPKDGLEIKNGKSKIMLYTVGNADGKWQHCFAKPNSRIVFSSLPNADGGKPKIHLNVNGDFLHKLTSYGEEVVRLVTEQSKTLTGSNKADLKFPFLRPPKEKDDGTFYDPIASFNIKNAKITVGKNQEDLRDPLQEDFRNHTVTAIKFTHRVCVPSKGKFIVTREVSELRLNPPDLERSVSIFDDDFDDMQI